ncbi:hypothetical protein OS493_010140 [Desmophyllum pertusum]|uniref:UEV domain-containing protein n=1 Tax=Desmophyllum pertusum TaxID=174260 RepID=A0A9X0CG50_9CNID|nr:hypothetical protein OS493_010140 [Desmophyllum pertusum]
MGTPVETYPTPRRLDFADDPNLLTHRLTDMKAKGEILEEIDGQNMVMEENTNYLPWMEQSQSKLEEEHPLVYVRPTSSMKIMESDQVDKNGLVYHPDLHEWNYVCQRNNSKVYFSSTDSSLHVTTCDDKTSSVKTLLQNLCGVFAKRPPVCALDTDSSSLGQQQPPPPSNPTSNKQPPPPPSNPVPPGSKPISSSKPLPAMASNPSSSSQQPQGGCT